MAVPLCFNFSDLALFCDIAQTGKTLYFAEFLLLGHIVKEEQTLSSY